MSRVLALTIMLFVCAIVTASVATGVYMLLSSSRTQTVSSDRLIAAGSDAEDFSIIPGQTPALLSDMKILPFNLIDQDGNPVDETIFDGRVSIIDFFFTRCPGPCPVMSAEMRRIQQELEGVDVQFVSFSVDAGFDNPEVLRAYAESFEADLSTWTFLTGDSAQIEALMIDGLGFAFERDESAQVQLSDGSVGPNVLHPTHFILVGPDRRVLALAPVGNHEHIDLLVEGARRLAE